MGQGLRHLTVPDIARIRSGTETLTERTASGSWKKGRCKTMKSKKVPTRQAVLRELDSLINHYRACNDQDKAAGVGIQQRMRWIVAVEDLKAARVKIVGEPK